MKNQPVASSALTLPDFLIMVGDKQSLLQQIMDFIQMKYAIEPTYRYYKKYGWNMFYRKSGKSLAIIAPKEHQFLVTVVIGSTLNETIHASVLSEKAKQMFDDAHQYHDGRWLCFDVQSQQDIEDIKLLLFIKRKPMH